MCRNHSNAIPQPPYFVSRGSRTFESVNEFLLCCAHSNESHRAVLSCGAFIILYKVALTLESVDEILKCDHSNESY